jgi:hypothetical protein
MGQAEKGNAAAGDEDDDGEDDNEGDKLYLVEDMWNANIDPKTRKSKHGLLNTFWGIFRRFRSAEVDPTDQKLYAGMRHRTVWTRFRI